jgi:hypothetical protein
VPLDQDAVARELVFKTKQLYLNEGAADVQECVVHPGPRAWKTVSLLTFVDPDTGEVTNRKLQAQTWKAARFSAGYDFTRTEFSWSCEGEEEIEAIRALLNGEFGEPGRYRLVRQGTETASMLELLDGGSVGSSDLVNVFQAASQIPGFIAAIAGTDGGRALANAVELQNRKYQIDVLKEVVEDFTKNEHDIHRQLRKMDWIFGGSYVGETYRRQLTTGEILDVPLMRPDGSLHVVELKQANIEKLVRRHRGPRDAPKEVAGRRPELPFIVGDDVNEAVGQGMNYLRNLDEQRDSILNRFALDVRRASVTVLIGHPKFVVGEIPEEDVSATLRMYNSHLTRVEVRHYKELIESAERALMIADRSSNESDTSDKYGHSRDGRPNVGEPDDPWGADDPWLGVAPLSSQSGSDWASVNPPPF